MKRLTRVISGIFREIPRKIFREITDGCPLCLGRCGPQYNTGRRDLPHGGVVMIIKKIGLGNCIKNEWVVREKETVTYTSH